jgi:hypothetical protein
LASFAAVIFPAGGRAQCVPEPEERAVLLQASAGMGVGSRGFSRPHELGEQQLPDVAFPAAAVALRVEGWPDAPFSLTGLLRYRTSLGLEVQEHPPFALPNELGARAAHTELSVAPTFRLGDDRARAFRLAVPVGLSVRSFWPDIRELVTPGYSLLGPFVRVELIAPLPPWLLLRVGPELQAILVLDQHMKKAGLEGQGLALGGELGVEVGPFLSWLSLELSYRESHAWVGNRSDGPDLADAERFVILSVRGEL